MKSIKLFYSYYRLLSFFGITPGLFKSSSFENITVKLCVGLLLGLYTFLLVNAIQERITLNYNLNKYNVMVNLIKTAIEVIVGYTPIVISLRRRKCWKLLLSELKQSEYILKNYYSRTALFLNVIKIVCIYLLVAIQPILYFISSFNESINILLHHITFWTFAHLYQASVVCLISVITKVIKELYENAAESLTNDWSKEDEIKKCQERYSILNDMLSQFNNIFGWQILFIHANTVLAILNSVNYSYFIKTISAADRPHVVFSIATTVTMHLVSN